MPHPPRVYDEQREAKWRKRDEGQRNRASLTKQGQDYYDDIAKFCPDGSGALGAGSSFYASAKGNSKP